MKSIIQTLLLAAIVLAACTQPKKNESKPQTLIIGVMSSMDYFPLAVAAREGYFVEQGIDVSLQKFYAPNERDAALQSGNLDGTILDYTGGAIQCAGGINLRFTSQCDGTFELIAGKKSGIKSLNELKGKKMAVSRNTVIDFCTDMALEKAGLSDSDVEKSEINKIPLRLEMLRNARIDAAVLPDPFASLAKVEGNASIANLQELGYRVTGIAFHERVIKEKTDAIKKFYIAYNKAIETILSKPAQDFYPILIEEIGFTQEAVQSVKLPAYTLATLPQESDLTAIDNWLKGRNIVAPDFDIHTLIDSSFIP